MKREIRIQPRANEDLNEYARHIAKDNLSAALRLYDAANATYSFLAETPYAGQSCNFELPEMRDVRIWRIKRYPNYLIFYRVTSDAVVVVRILHAAQDRDRMFEAKPTDAKS